MTDAPAPAPAATDEGDATTDRESPRLELAPSKPEAVAKRPPLDPNARLEIKTVGDLQTFGRILAASGYFRDARDPAKAAVILLAGKELGLPPIFALMSMDVVDGRLALRSHAIAALIKRSGRYDYQIVEAGLTRAEIAFFALDYPEVVKPGAVPLPSRRSLGPTVTFTVEDAKRAGLAEKANYKKYPADMLYARALAKGARRYCPDVFMGGVYADDEVGEPTFAQPVDAPPARVTAARVQRRAPAVTPTPVATPTCEDDAAENDVVVTAAPAASAAASAGGPSMDSQVALLMVLLPADVATRLAAMGPADQVDVETLREVHAHLEDRLGESAAKGAWKDVGVEVRKGAKVSAGQVVTLCRTKAQRDAVTDAGAGW